MEMPPVRYARTDDDVAIAYTVAGSGPVLLRPPGWVTHLEQTWSSVARGLTEQLAEFFTVVQYDKRGTGLSDRDVEDISLEAQLLDLEAVVAAIDSPRLAIFAGSGGGPPSLLFTARNPERVICLALYGSYAAGPSARGEEPDYMHAVIRANWGVATRAFADRFMPGVDATRSMIEAFAEDQRVSASADVAARIWETREHLDVREHLPDIVVPTLVVHLTGDLVVPIERGREIASLIPGAEFVPLEGENHRPATAEDGARIMGAVLPFLQAHMLDAEPADGPAPGGFQTILFTDLESSTALTQRVGDEAAQEVLRGHNSAVRGALEANGGREVKHTGDGIMAAFPSAVAAVTAALQMQRGLAGGEVRVRIGLNAGEPIAEDDDLFGLSVIKAARIGDRAEPGQVLVSRVVMELCEGKSFEFTSMGDATLKGLDEPVALYAVGVTVARQP